MASNSVAAAPGQVEMHGHDELMALQARSPAYRILIDNEMMTEKYRIIDVNQIPKETANSTPCKNACYKCMCCLCGSVFKTFEVPEGYLMKGTDGQGGTMFYSKGVHLIKDAFIGVEGLVPLTAKQVIHRNKALVTIDQGYIGYAMDRGQPVLLPPGMHYWESSTLRFERAIDLSQHVITLGPYTLVTVDEGYSAVTQNNGKQVILSGGKVHLLTHRNWKFEKFMTEKIQTDELGQILATTGDNVLLETASTVNWRISDVITASRMAAQTMKSDGSSVRGEDIVKLRSDVLKQATASLAAYIGGVRYSDSFHLSAQNVPGINDGKKTEPESEDVAHSPLFDMARLETARSHCNEVCNKYGVTVMSINIISAKPRDAQLMNQLAAGAVAAAAAEQAETAARGNAKAKMIVAKAQAEAERTTAEGSRDAAQILEESAFAVELARIGRAGDAIKDKTTFFFGGHPQQLPALLANPSVVKK